MKRFLLAVAFVVFILQGSSAKASDSFAALIGGDQDILILGTITEIEGDRCTIHVEKKFPGANSSINRQLSLEKIPNVLQACKINARGYTNDFTRNKEIKVGMKLFGSFNRDDVGWSSYFVWAVNTFEPEKIQVISDSDSDSYCIQAFLNSNGRIREFFYDRGNVLATYPDGVRRMIYSSRYAGYPDYLAQAAVAAKDMPGAIPALEQERKFVLLIKAIVILEGLASLAAILFFRYRKKWLFPFVLLGNGISMWLLWFHVLK